MFELGPPQPVSYTPHNQKNYSFSNTSCTQRFFQNLRADRIIREAPIEVVQIKRTGAIAFFRCNSYSLARLYIRCSSSANVACCLAESIRRSTSEQSGFAALNNRIASVNPLDDGNVKRQSIRALNVFVCQRSGFVANKAGCCRSDVKSC